MSKSTDKRKNVLASDGASDYSIVYKTNPLIFPALELENAFKRFAKVTLPISKVHSEDKKELVLMLKGDLAKDTFGYKMRNGNIYFYAENVKALYFSVQHFAENHMKNIENRYFEITGNISYEGVLENYSKDEWQLLIPGYDTGVLTETLYNCGSGFENDAEGKGTLEDSFMHIVSETSAYEFNEYLKKLEKIGYARDFYNEINGNLYARYVYGNSVIYTYYVHSQKAVRIIEDRSSNVYLNEICRKTNVSGNIEFYQYSIDYTKGCERDEHAINCGMFYILKLEDNSLILVDGGHYRQARPEAVEAMYKFLYEITNTPYDEKLNIAAWYITHPDGDHVTICFKLLEYMNSKPHGLPEIGTFVFNFPSTLYMGQASECAIMRAKVKEFYPYINYLQIFSGMELSFCGVNMEILYTHEAAFQSDATLLVKGTNDACSLINFQFDGFKIMLLGDHNRSAQGVVFSMYSAKNLKSDAVQIAHHSFNSIPDYYKAIDAPIVFAPQSYENAIATRGYSGYMARALSWNTVFFAGDYTSKLVMREGLPEITKIPRYDAE